MARKMGLSVLPLWAFVGSVVASSECVVKRDVAIIGGGSSGTYAAIRLQQLGYSVAVVEKDSVLGGHVDTFHVPGSDTTFDYGVSIFYNNSLTLDYFATLGIETVVSDSFSTPPSYANFHGSGVITEVPASISWSNQTALGVALYTYAQILAQQFPYLATGFDLPDPVPEDLLMPWGDFLTKYGLDPMSFTAHITVQGAANSLKQPAIYMMKSLHLELVQTMLGIEAPLITTVGNNNQHIYDSALNILGSSAFVSASVKSVRRDSSGVVVVTATPSGTKIIKAKKLLIAIQPKLPSLEALGLDLTADERSLFGQFNNSHYWDMVIKNSGIPQSVSFSNADFSAADGIPALPAPYVFVPTGAEGYTRAFYSSPYPLADDEVKADVLASAARIVAANGYNAGGAAEPEFVGFNDHSPFMLTVSTDLIRQGFYPKVNALQGLHNTWFTGATWEAHDSGKIWAFNENVLLPALVASLKE